MLLSRLGRRGEEIMETYWSQYHPEEERRGGNNFQMHRDRIVYVHNKITNHNFPPHTEEQAARESRAG